MIGTWIAAIGVFGGLIINGIVGYYAVARHRLEIKRITREESERANLMSSMLTRSDSADALLRRNLLLGLMRGSFVGYSDTIAALLAGASFVVAHHVSGYWRLGFISGGVGGLIEVVMSWLMVYRAWAREAAKYGVTVDGKLKAADTPAK